MLSFGSSTNSNTSRQDKASWSSSSRPRRRNKESTLELDGLRKHACHVVRSTKSMTTVDDLKRLTTFPPASPVVCTTPHLEGASPLHSQSGVLDATIAPQPTGEGR